MKLWLGPLGLGAAQMGQRHTHTPSLGLDHTHGVSRESLSPALQHAQETPASTVRQALGWREHLHPSLGCLAPPVAQPAPSLSYQLPLASHKSRGRFRAGAPPPCVPWPGPQAPSPPLLWSHARVHNSTRLGIFALAGNWAQEWLCESQSGGWRTQGSGHGVGAPGTEASTGAPGTEL